MLGKMKLKSDIGWKCEEEILKVLGLKEGDNAGVKFSLYYHNITSFRSYFRGIRLEVVDVNYHSVYRRVPVRFDRDQKIYTIDLDQIVEKYEELKKMSKQIVLLLDKKMRRRRVNIKRR